MSGPAGKGKVHHESAETHVSGRAQRRLEEQRKAKQKQFGFIGGAILAAVIVVGILIIATRDSDSDNSSVTLPAAMLDASIPRDGRILGDPNAPVTIVEYSDYQCPFCKRFHEDVFPQLRDEYIKTGKVKFVYTDYTLIDGFTEGDYGESDRAADAVACAGAQGKFWEMHDTVMHNQTGENIGGFTKANLAKMAELLDLNMGDFNSCLDDRDYKDEIAAGEEQGKAMGVSGTPSLFINGVKVDYTGRYADLKKDIDAVLGA